MRELRLLLLVGIFANTIGCGDDGGEASPAQQCEAFFEAFCTSNASCRPPSDRAKSREDCLFVTRLDLDCKSVTSVGNSYADCMNEIPEAKCTTMGGITLPSSCSRVLITGGGF
jgi:hypothetical protein